MIKKELTGLGFPGYELYEDGRVWDIRTQKFLTEYMQHNDYRRVSMYNVKTSNYTNALVHRLVAMAYVANPKGKSEVRHKDGDHSNNHYSNLEWVTRAENLQKEAELKGTSSGILDANTVHYICYKLSKGIGCTELAREVGCSRDAIFLIKNGTNWKHISSTYNIEKPKKQAPKLTEDIVIDICNKFNDGWNVDKVSEHFSISKDVVRKIRARKNWTKVTDIYLKV